MFNLTRCGIDVRTNQTLKRICFQGGFGALNYREKSERTGESLFSRYFSAKNGHSLGLNKAILIDNYNF